MSIPDEVYGELEREFYEPQDGGTEVGEIEAE